MSNLRSLLLKLEHWLRLPSSRSCSSIAVPSTLSHLSRSAKLSANLALEISPTPRSLYIHNKFLAKFKGGVVGASAGTLAFMFGAPDHLVPKILPVLALMGTKERLFHTGAPGSGLGAKLANNYLAGTITVGLCEAMNMGIKMGLDPKKLADIFSVSTSKNWISDFSNPVPGVIPTAAASNGYKGGFRLALAKKDIGLAVEAAKMVHSKMVIGPNILSIYEDVASHPEYRDMDITIIWQWLLAQEKN